MAESLTAATAKADDLRSQLDEARHQRDEAQAAVADAFAEVEDQQRHLEFLQAEVVNARKASRADAIAEARRISRASGDAVCGGDMAGGAPSVVNKTFHEELARAEEKLDAIELELESTKAELTTEPTECQSSSSQREEFAQPGFVILRHEDCKLLNESCKLAIRDAKEDADELRIQLENANAELSAARK